MTTYELLCHTNVNIIQGKIYSDDEKREITQKLLLSVSSREAARRFHQGVKAPADGRLLYPIFFIPPYNHGKKLRLITGELPKTHILSANHYELEILRILALWDADNPQVQLMLEETLQRLRTTCFARFCPAGECVGAGVITLRFLSALRQRDDGWMEMIRRPLFRHYCDNKKDRSKIDIPVFYMYAALSDMTGEACRHVAEQKKDWIIHMLKRGCLTGPAVSDTYNVLRLYILRNALAMLPGYEHMKGSPVYISDDDQRCYCDVSFR